MSFKSIFFAAASLVFAASLSTYGAEASGRRGGVLPPFAYIQFCVHHASACKDTKGRLATIDGSKVTMTPKLQRELADINSSVNSSIQPRARGPGDPWTAGGKFGDCNAYALTKRAKLIAAGWPSRALSLTVVKTSWGEGHLVLSVHTSTGVMVLDNLSHSVRSLSQVPYHLIAMQGGSALQWGAGSDSAAIQ
jgi:predicted transglutaminase-like cysteine proteinase